MIVATLFGETVVTKACNKCGVEQAIDNFRARTRNRQGIITERRNECNKCNGNSQKQVKKLKKTVSSIDQETYVCPLCYRSKADLSHLSYKNPFVLEHDHATGAVRGWVCQDCNTAIARIQDNAETAKRIVRYLEDSDRSAYLGAKLGTLFDEVIYD